MAEAVLSQISGDFLECTICLEPYKDPKILPCVHTFCKGCLEKFVAKESKVKDRFPCPTCRIETALPEGGVAGLKNNFFVLSLRDTVDAHKSLVSKEDDKVTCDNCEEHVANFGCVVCEEFLCEECARAHRRGKRTRDHEVIGVAELKEQLITKTSSVKSRSLPMCPKHEDEKLKFYCETCQSPICRDCTVLKHKDHKYGLLADVVGDVRAKIKDKLANARPKIVEYRDAASVTATKQAELDTRSKKAADDIDAAAEEEIKYYTGLVRRKQTELKDKLAAVTAARSKQLSATADSVESTLGCLSSTVDFSQKVVEHGSDFDVMNVYSDVTVRLESLLKGPTPDIPDDISYVRFDPKTKRKEKEIVLGDIVDSPFRSAKLTTLRASGRLGPTTLGTHYRGQDHEHLVTLHDGIQHFTVPETGTYSIEATDSFRTAKLTTLGASGRLGPTTMGTHYRGQDHEHLVTLHDGIQHLTVPRTGMYSIEAAGWGVHNPKSARGRGAVLRGTFNLKQGETLKILVGQEGAENKRHWGVGGGGGTFVTRGDLDNTPLIIAGGGGGGGAWLKTHNPLCDGTVSTTGNKNYGGSGCSGGSNGQGATGWKGSCMGGGGGGLLTDGGSSKQLGGDSCDLGGEGGKAFVNGGVGGRGAYNNADGGFGGGGGSYGGGAGGGGGGGYSGGGRGVCTNPNGGGGGGSFNSGTDSSGQGGANDGPGHVRRTGAAMAEAVLSQISGDFLECTICLEPYKDPKILPCLHTFCKDSLEKFVAKQGKEKGRFPCPTCRIETILPEGGVAGLKNNFFVLSLRDTVDAHKSLVSMEDDKVTCDNCEEHVANFGRVVCEEFLCDDCGRVHRRAKRTRGHEVIGVAELKEQLITKTSSVKSRSLPMCPKHEDEKLKFYCETCQSPICRDCKDLQHKDHKYDLLADVVSDVRVKMKGNLATAGAKIEQYRDAANVTATKQAELDTRSKKAADDIDAAAEEEIKYYTGLVRRKQTELKEKLAAVTAARSKQLSATADSVEGTFGCLSSTVDFSQKVVEHGSDFDVMNVYSDVTARLESLLKGPTPDIPDDISYVRFDPKTERGDTEIILGDIVEHQPCFQLTTLGASGRLGPTTLGTHYRGQDHEHLVTLHDGIQHFTVPRTGTYSMEAAGAAAGWGKNNPKSARGRGAVLRGTFNLKQGETLKILVGQEGAENKEASSVGGGGGTFVTRGDNTPLIIAGGGGGSRAGPQTHIHNPLCDGTVSTTGNKSYGGSGCSGGSNGQGATEWKGTWMGGGGGGLLTDGGSSKQFGGDSCRYGGEGGKAFVNGGVGGRGNCNNADGGFGGGGGSEGAGGGGGGGGGYSGGGRGECRDPNGGGGGGSFNSGTDTSGQDGANDGPGYVVITRQVHMSHTGAVMAEAVLSQISGDFLECTICLESYKDPKILPCLHTFCKACLEKFVAKQGEAKDKFPCPTCRIQTVLPEGGVAGLKNNFFVLSLRDTVDAHKSLVSMEDDKVTCDNCEEHVAHFGCVVCEEFLCEECGRVHRRGKRTRDHEVIGVAELKEQLIAKTSSVKSRSLPMCPKHEDEKLKFYCETCQHPICRDCTVLQHKDHKYGLLADVVSAVRAKIKGNLEAARPKIEEYRDAASVTAKKQTELDTRSKKVADDIDAAAEEEIKYYTGLVRRKQTELKEKLAAVTAARSKQLSATADSVESTLGCLSSTVDFSRKVVEHGSDFDVMNVYCDVTARLESLLKGPTPDIPDVISYVRFQPSRERKETEIILGDFVDHQPCFKLTTLGGSGRLGPTTLGTHYRGQDHEHLVTLHDGIQHFTVPRTGTYSIEAAGAAAGWGLYNPKSARGRGAILRGTFNLKRGETLKILVGQEGAENRSNWGVGGGGGTFVTRGDNTPLIIAGGGGGAGVNLLTHNPLCDGNVSTTGNKSYKSYTSTYRGTGCSGGSNGQGATEWQDGGMGGGGGGLLTDGGSSKQFRGDSCKNGGEGGKAFVNGGVGGRGVYLNADGGFGGGGGSHGFGCGGGGGGGYSGGGRGENRNPNGGGGGGSFNSGSDTSGQDGANDGPGYVVITRQAPSPYLSHMSRTGAVMAAAALSSQIAADFLECKICLQPFKEPKTLPCLHTFCKVCLQNVVLQQDELDSTESSDDDEEETNKFPCPICRTETVLPEGGVAGLKDNFFVLSLRDTVESHRTLASNDKVPCDVCEEVASCGCAVCEEFFCEDCARTHRRAKRTRDHEVIGVAELSQQLISNARLVKSTSLPICPKHEDEKLKFYCETCQSPICRDCTVLQHKDHKYAYLADVVSDVRAKIKDKLATSRPKIVEYRDITEFAAMKQAELDTRSKKAADDIDAAAEEEIKYYTGLVRRKQTELKEELAAVTAARSKQLSATADSVESTLGCLSSTVDFSHKVVEYGSDFDVMNVYSDVTARLESLLKSPTPDIPDDISYVRFKPRKERKKGEIIFGDIVDHPGTPKQGRNQTTATFTAVQPGARRRLGPTTRYCSFRTATLTTLGASGRLGPTTLGTHYRGQDHEHLLTLHAGIQHFTVPGTGTYNIEAAGAAAGWGEYNPKSTRGRGAVLRGTFNLKQGETLKILVGQEGAGNVVVRSVGGGGGTFVTRGDNTPLIIAGGGGAGVGLKTHKPLCDGTVSTTGNKAYGGIGCSGGSNGQGATEWKYNCMGGGGGGLLTDGGSSKQFGGDSCQHGGEGGKAFVNGGVGGRGVYHNANGGFGGGGGSHGDGGGRGGGGGYSGGGRGESTFPNGGGGGGSFNSGTDTSGQDGANNGPGYVVITRQA
ncbi:PREDICTED: LOW QUALITY PROTEIN: uncharacterized protein LOC109487324 [Branchiostoma belcheri]|uniref:LOW QUALITY PROTEIN: uncharacterized protein LOC109487324 n=1 Tax=Branchiostoma belcheri TaxID=7741 RepID=A0A6P5AUU7_BRABE|nr:PREDICTED: LOW QUALITY PROTEIN: uncharacterized protein LOC109487324 [Branchiostoma belcheri]